MMDFFTKCRRDLLAGDISVCSLPLCVREEHLMLCVCGRTRKYAALQGHFSGRDTPTNLPNLHLLNTAVGHFQRTAPRIGR